MKGDNIFGRGGRSMQTGACPALMPALTCRAVFSLFFLATLFGGGLGARRAEIAPDITLTRITTDGKSEGLSLSPKGGRIAFFKRITGQQRQLWTMRADGSDPHAISPVGNPYYVSWSWDGKKIGYVFSLTQEETGGADLFVSDADGSNQAKITIGMKRANFALEDKPVWSPDSTKLCFDMEVNEADHLWVASADGTHKVRLAPNNETSHSPCWSPDSQSLAFLSSVSEEPYEPNVYVTSADAVTLRPLTRGPWENRRPKWSWDGDKICFLSQKARLVEEREQYQYDLWITRPDGSDLQVLASGSSPATEKRRNFMAPWWSYDSKYIAVWGYQYDNLARPISTLFLVDPATGKFEPIVSGEAPGSDQVTRYISYFQWSYDSKMIAYVGWRFTKRGQPSAPSQEYPLGVRLEDERHVVGVYDVQKRENRELLVYRPREDRVAVLSYFADPAWSEDNRSLLVTLGKVVSEEQGTYEPDMYVLTLPEPAKPAVSEAPPAPAEAPPAPAPPEEPPSAAPGAVAISPCHLTAEEAVASLPKQYAAYIQVNIPRNLLVVTAPPAVVEQLKRDLALIDTPAPQIVVDVLVTELSKSGSRALGFDWRAARGRFGALLPFGPSGPGEIFYQGVGKLDEEFLVTLSLLEEQGKANITANPRIVSVSGHEAVINIRRTVNFFFREGIDFQGQPITRKSDISADIVVKIKPILIGNDQISTDIDATVGSFVFTKASSLPDVTNRQATTRVIVPSGDTIVIGGLTQKETTRATSKVPLLGDLPLLGGLFRSSRRETRETVLTIFITPRLLARGEAPSRSSKPSS